VTICHNRKGPKKARVISLVAKRDPTRREHFLELLQKYGWRSSKLARPEEFDHLALVTESYPQPRHD